MWSENLAGNKEELSSQNVWLSSGEERQDQNGWWRTRMCLQGLVRVHFAWEGLCVCLLICCWCFMLKGTEAGGASVRNPVERVRKYETKRVRGLR